MRRRASVTSVIGVGSIDCTGSKPFAQHPHAFAGLHQAPEHFHALHSAKVKFR
jgi:hypothetical protein